MALDGTSCTLHHLHSSHVHKIDKNMLHFFRWGDQLRCSRCRVLDHILFQQLPFIFRLWHRYTCCTRSYTLHHPTCKCICLRCSFKLVCEQEFILFRWSWGIYFAIFWRTPSGCSDGGSVWASPSEIGCRGNFELECGVPWEAPRSISRFRN